MLFLLKYLLNLTSTCVIYKIYIVSIQLMLKVGITYEQLEISNLLALYLKCEGELL